MKTAFICLFAAASFSAFAQSVTDYPSFAQSESYPMSLQLNGNIVEEKAWQTMKKQTWTGIFTNSANSSYTTTTELQGIKTQDPWAVNESGNNKEGWREIAPKNSDECLFLISGLKVPEHKISTFDMSMYLLPDSTQSVDYKGLNYRIYAEGEYARAEGGEVISDIKNYKVYLEVQENGKTSRQLLVAREYMDEAAARILFAGDIDEDGKLDFIMDTSDHYNVYAPTLYLSKPADKGSFLKVMAQHISAGC